MHAPFSMEQVQSSLAAKLPERIVVERQELVVEFGLVRPFDPPAPPRFRTVRSTETFNSCLVGILFCPPEGPLAKSEIVPHLNYFHHRSGESVDFFCVGYGTNWPSGKYSDQREVAKIDGVAWQYSDAAYAATAAQYEEATTWTDTGEASLLLLVARRRRDGSIYFDFTTAVVCNLELMTKHGAINSVRSFFNSIFRYAKDQGQSTLELSDSEGVRIAKGVLKDGILSLLPKAIADNFKAAEHFAVRDISKEA